MPLTDHWLESGFDDLNQTVIDPDAKIDKNLSVISQIKVAEAVFVLFWRVVILESLSTTCQFNLSNFEMHTLKANGQPAQRTVDSVSSLGRHYNKKI